MKKMIADESTRAHDMSMHFLKKVYEKLHLLFTHHIPNGKQPPEITRDLIYELWKMDYSGVLENMSKEPLIQPVVTQPELFKDDTANVSVKNPIKPNGTDVDNKKV